MQNNNRIWLVEGDPELRLALAKRFRHHKYSVREFDSPQHAQDTLNALVKGSGKLPGLVIASNDFDSFTVNGIDLAQSAKANNVPVFVMSENDSIKHNVIQKGVPFLSLRSLNLDRLDNFVQDIFFEQKVKDDNDGKKSETADGGKNLIWMVGRNPDILIIAKGDLQNTHDFHAFPNADNAIAELRTERNKKPGRMPSAIIADHPADNTLNISSLANKAEDYNVPLIVLSDDTELSKKFKGSNVAFSNKRFSDRELLDLVDEAIAAHSGRQLGRSA